MIMPFRVVYRKEMSDNLRDRRSMTSALLVPLLGPLMFGLVFTAVARSQREDKPLLVPIAGARNARSLVGFLERHGAIVQDAPADYEAKVRDGDLDLAVSVPEDYGKDWEGGRSAQVRLVVDNSRSSARSQVRRVQKLLAAYASQIGALRLLARGVSPQLAAPVVVEELDLATPEKIAGSALAMIPLFLLMATFLGGMYLAIDATAGERERGSLEPLLLNPVSRQAIVTGKWLAVVSATWIAIAVSIAGFEVALARVPLQDLGLKASLGPVQVAYALAALLPLSLLAASLQMVLALFARSFKEAQTWLSLLMFIPLIPAALLSVNPVKPQLWMTAVPVLGQTVMLSDIVRGEMPPASWVVVAALAAAVAAFLCIAIAVHMLADERIVLGRAQAG